MKFTTSILPFLSLIPAITSIPVSDASTSPFSATQISTLSSSINDSLPSSNSPSPFVVGIYNVSFYSLNLPLETVKEILPSKYRDSILEINEDQTVKVILEAGHQSMNGPPGLGILNNEEAKLEIPGIGRVEESDVGFTYKSHIFVNSFVAALFGALVFGLTDTFEIIRPKDSSNAPTFDYSVKNYMNITNVRISDAKKGQTDFQAVQNGPWFADGLLCGRHQYENSDFSNTIADVTLYPKILKKNPWNSEPLVIKDVEGVHFVSNFTIFGPAKCSSFL